MRRTVSAVEARKKFGQVLEGVFYRNDEIVIERAGKPMAVVIPMYLYENIERGRDRLMQLIEKNWELNKNVPLEDIEKDIEEAIREVRAERRRDASA